MATTKKRIKERIEKVEKKIKALVDQHGRFTYNLPKYKNLNNERIKLHKQLVQK